MTVFWEADTPLDKKTAFQRLKPVRGPWSPQTCRIIFSFLLGSHVLKIAKVECHFPKLRFLFEPALTQSQYDDMMENHELYYRD